MPPITISTMLQWSRVPAAHRNAVIAELMPEGLTDLDAFTAEEIQLAIKGFRTLPGEQDRFTLTAATVKRITQLSYWVKDRMRLGLPVEFEAGTSSHQFFLAIDESQQRDAIRKEKKKAAEGLTTLKIDPPLRSASGWEAWAEAVKSALTNAYGSNGVPLLYVIRDIDYPTYEDEDWEELAVSATPLRGLAYESDRKTVHMFITNNIKEDSDAHAYIQPVFSKNDGRLDWKVLTARYENPAMVQSRVNQANQVWEQLVYKNERAMSFEIFAKKLNKALQHFDKAGRPKHDGDVIDWIWQHIQCGELTQLVNALKAGQSIHERGAQEILQEIAKEVPNITKSSNFRPRISEIGRTAPSSGFTFVGSAPEDGAYTADGKLFCGSYAPTQWFSDSMAPYRAEIIAIRNKHQPKNPKSRMKTKGSNPHKRTVSKHAQAKRRFAQLKTQTEALARTLATLKAKEEETPGQIPKRSGEQFGGRNSMHPNL